MKRILIISGSPKKNGNTAQMIDWFLEGIDPKKARVELVRAAALKTKSAGCTSCRKCQKTKPYGCVIGDDITAVLGKMAQADIIVMATPLYFFAMSAQLKAIVDRMFSLYKWDNEAGTMKTCLKGKTLVLLASAFENIGLDDLARPFILTAEYSGMKFASLLVPNAGVSGNIRKLPGIREKVSALSRKLTG